MADTLVATGLSVQQWDSKFFKQYIRSNRFSRYMGTDEGAMIQVKEDLTKKKGDTIHFALLNRLTQAAILGSATLEGNEEDLATRSHPLTVNKRRNGVRIPEMEEQKSAIPLRNAARAALMDWSMEDTRDQIITAFGSINGVAYSLATEGEKDAWLVDNADRVLFGALNSNNAANDHSAALAQIDNSADKLTAAAVSLMKRKAALANPKIRPIRVEGDREFFVMFTDPLNFRNLKNDSVIIQAQREVSIQSQNNRLFQGGDVIWDGVVVREIAEIGVVSNGTINVAPAYLTGAQALGMGWAKRWRTVTEDFDYGDKHGVAVEGIMGVNKLTFGTGSGDRTDLKDNGIVTGWFSAVADA